jgi:hypothetical protein
MGIHYVHASSFPNLKLPPNKKIADGENDFSLVLMIN